MCINCSDTVGQLKEKIQELGCAAQGILSRAKVCSSGFQGQCLVVDLLCVS